MIKMIAKFSWTALTEYPLETSVETVRRRGWCGFDGGIALWTNSLAQNYIFLDHLHGPLWTDFVIAFPISVKTSLISSEIYYNYLFPPLYHPNWVDQLKEEEQINI